MNDRYNLTRGPILPELIKVSIPVILTSLVQMAYNLTDIFWLGRVSKDAVSSAGFGGFFTWLGAAVFLLVQIGTQVHVSQQVGKHEYENAKMYAKSGIQTEFVVAILYALVIFLFTAPLIRLFNIRPEDYLVEKGAIAYLKIISIGMTFYLINPIFSAILNGTGNTRIPFIISAIGLALNMILDPVFILMFHMDVQGAAYATIIAQATVTGVFLLYSHFSNSILHKLSLFSRINPQKIIDILKIGLPVALQSALFTFIAMYIARFVTPFGSAANATQKIGSQIESLSWLTAGGIQTALGAFVGQNFGAKQYKRVLQGVRYALLTMSIYGLFVTALLFFFAKPLFSIFLNADDLVTTLPLGVDYLKILAISQMFMIFESTIGGAFYGLGKSFPSSIVSILFNLARIPMAFIFIPIYGLNGIWMAITISSTIKGIIILIWFTLYVRFHPIFSQYRLDRRKKDVIMEL